MNPGRRPGNTPPTHTPAALPARWQSSSRSIGTLLHSAAALDMYGGRNPRLPLMKTGHSHSLLILSLTFEICYTRLACGTWLVNTLVQKAERRPDHTRYNDRTGGLYVRGAIHSSSCIRYSHTVSKRLHVPRPIWHQGSHKSLRQRSLNPSLTTLPRPIFSCRCLTSSHVRSLILTCDA